MKKIIKPTITFVALIVIVAPMQIRNALHGKLACPYFILGELCLTWACEIYDVEKMKRLKREHENRPLDT